MNNSPFSTPIENHLYSPISSTNSPYNKMVLNSNYNQSDLIGREDFDNQALEMNYNYNSPIPHNNIPCLKATPSIHGSRVFGGNANTANNSCHSSPFNPPSPISISPETSMNNNYLIDDFVRMLLMECQKIQVNQDRTIKTASSPHGNNVSSTYSCPSFMNGAIGSSNNLKRFVAGIIANKTVYFVFDTVTKRI